MKPQDYVKILLNVSDFKKFKKDFRKDLKNHFESAYIKIFQYDWRCIPLHLVEVPRSQLRDFNAALIMSTSWNGVYGEKVSDYCSKIKDYLDEKRIPYEVYGERKIAKRSKLEAMATAA